MMRLSENRGSLLTLSSVSIIGEANDAIKREQKMLAYFAELTEQRAQSRIYSSYAES